MGGQKKCQTARRKRRKAERDNRRLQTADSKLDYKKAVKHAEAVINTTRQLYYENRLKSCEDNKKDTYKIVNQLMDRDISKNLKPFRDTFSFDCFKFGIVKKTKPSLLDREEARFCTKFRTNVWGLNRMEIKR